MPLCYHTLPYHTLPYGTDSSKPKFLYLLTHYMGWLNGFMPMVDTWDIWDGFIETFNKNTSLRNGSEQVMKMTPKQRKVVVVVVVVNI